MSASDRRLGPYLRTAADLDAVEQKLDANNADVVGGIDAGGGMAAPSGWLAVFLVMAVGGLCDPLTLWRSGRKPGVAR